MKTTTFLAFPHLLVWLVMPASAAPFEFYGTVTEKILIDAASTDLRVEITPDVEVTVKVTDLTEIRDQNGRPISVDEITEGALVAVEAMHTEGGLLALLIRVQGSGHTFEIRGLLEEVASAGIVVAGIPIGVQDSTEIKDEANLPLTLEELEKRLEADGTVWVKVEGFAQNGALVAAEIKIQPSRHFARISLEGVVDRFDNNGGDFYLDIGGGAEVLVKLTEDTVIRGGLVAGAYVRVTGHINQDLAVVAASVSVVGLFELSPNQLRMGFEETREVTVVLRQPLSADLVLEVESLDLAVADAGSSSVLIEAGNLSAVIEVTSGTSAGRTEIVVTAPEAFGSAARSVRVTVGDISGFGGPPHPLGLGWAPRVVRAAPQGWVDVNLRLQFGAAPEDLVIRLELVDFSEDLDLEHPDTVVIPQGERFVRLRLLFHSRTGSGLLRATLNEGDDEVTAELDIDLRPPATPGTPGTPTQPNLGIVWTPPRVQVGAGSEFTATLRLTPRAPEVLDVRISVSETLATGRFPSVVPVAAGQQEVRVRFVAPDAAGRIRYRAALSREFGGGHADLEVAVF